MISLLIYAAPFVLGLILLVALVSAYTSFRRARSAPYYRIRRDASRAGWRSALIVLLCAAGLYGALSVRGSYGPPDLADLARLFPTPAAGPTPTSGPGAALTTSPGPTRDPLLSPPSITPTQPPTTPSATPFIATIESEVTSPPDASITLTTISTGISSSLEPVDPGTFFSSGLPRVYFFISFENMANGLSWSRALLLDGKVIRTVSEAWDQGAEGSAYYWFEAQGGFPQGGYEAQFYIGDKLSAKGVFTLR